jgi:hypothetical protein
MYGRAPSLGGSGGGKSTSDGSGVVIRNELIYLVSATSRFSSISSRSSMSRASAWVSLMIAKASV